MVKRRILLYKEPVSKMIADLEKEWGSRLTRNEGGKKEHDSTGTAGGFDTWDFTDGDLRRRDPKGRSGAGRDWCAGNVVNIGR